MYLILFQGICRTKQFQFVLSAAAQTNYNNFLKINTMNNKKYKFSNERFFSKV